MASTMAAEPENPESKYEVREVIGKGAFGEVNLVVEKQTKQKFVLKRIKMARQSEWQRRATRQEIEIVSRLRHPFVMPYKEHWIHHGHTINVVYGYCEKGDLTTAITKQRGKLFTEDTLRLWLAELLLAVDYMHRQNVLHRDIKTQNILLTGDGDVQIGDFGLSTVRVPSSDPAQQQIRGDDASSYGRFDSVPSILFDTADALVLGADVAGGATPNPSTRGCQQVHSSPTLHIQPHGHNAGLDAYTVGLANAVHANGHHVGHAQPPEQQHKEKDKDHAQTPVHDPKAGTRNDYALVGTPHFMSPELLSSQKYSYETDIWSLGVVMYELTTLKPPFNAFNLAGLVAKIKRAALPPIPSGYSADWTSILKSMLRKDPVRRATPLELLALPSMRPALQLAFQRALVIYPDFPVPDIPLPPIPEDSSSNTPGFCFDLAVGAAAVDKRTPTIPAANVTPVLVNPGGVTAAVTTLDDDLCGGSLLDTDSSPLSKFPDLAATSSPLPVMPTILSTNETRVSAPNLAAAAADPRRSKTPAVTRKVGITTGPGAAAPPAVAKCAASPLRARAGMAQPATAGTGRSKTPGRPLFGAAKAEEAPAPSSRLVRKPAMPTRTTGGAALPVSPREGTTGGAGIAAESSHGRVPAASPRPRGGAVSGPTPRVPALGSVRSVSGTRRGGLLDTIPTIAITTPRDTDCEVTTPDGKRQSFIDGAARPDSTPSTGQKSSPLIPGPVSRTSARAIKSTSVNTARTSRAALAAAAAAATTSPNSAVPKRAESATSGCAKRTTTSDGTAAAAPAAAPGTRRIVAAVASGATESATGASRHPRASSSPVRPTSAAAASVNAHANPNAASRVRRSQAGAGAAGPAAVGASKEAPEATTGTSGARPRVRRLSYMSYGTKPAGPDVHVAPRRTGTATGIVSGPVAAVAVVSASAAGRSASQAAGKPSEDSGAFSSHPLSASDTAPDSFPASASGSSPDMLSNAATVPASGPAAGVADGKAPPEGRPAGMVDMVSPRGAATAAVAGTVLGSPSAFAEVAMIPGPTLATPNAAVHPWRTNPRSRSLVSMTTEDSELSLPDGRYTTASEVSNGLCDNDLGLGIASASPSPLGSALPGGAPSQWNSNQLFSGSYNSLSGTMSDTTAAAAATVAAAVGAPVLVPNGVDPAAAANLTADLPRRVSISAFAPHLLYAGTAAAVAATAEGDTDVRLESDTASSFSAVSPVKHDSAKVVPLLEQLPVDDGSRPGIDGGVAGSFLSPRGLDPGSVLPSPTQAASSTATTPSSSAAPSPRPSPAKGVTSPAGGAVSSRRLQGADSAAGQSRRTGIAAGATATAPVTQPQRRVVSRTAAARTTTTSGAAQPSLPDTGLHSSTATVPKRIRPSSQPLSAMTTRPGTRAFSASVAATAAATTASTAALDLGAPLRTVPEDSGEEKEMAQAAAEEAKTERRSSAAASSLLNQLRESCQGLQDASAAVAAGGSTLSDGERQQLALLQRVVSLASSLWEAGRDEELGLILSSTLSRPLARRATKETPGQEAPTSGCAAECVDAGEDPSAVATAQQEAVPRSEDPMPGDTVRVTAGQLRGCEAVVRYRGPCHWGAGTVLGVELAPAALGAATTPAGVSEEPGTRDGVTYFRCQAAGARAAFVSPDQVARLTASSS